MDPAYPAVHKEHVEIQEFSGGPSICRINEINSEISGLYICDLNLREPRSSIDSRDLPLYSGPEPNYPLAGGTLALKGALI